MLNYSRYGEGATLILQHGFLGGGGYFAPQMAAFGHAFEVIAPDLPGYAGSASEPVVGSIKALSDSLVRLLDELEIDTFALLGHSMGGMIALQTALDHPDRVERLVLYATHSSGHLPGRFETFDETARRVTKEGVKKTAERVVKTWFVDGEQSPLYPFCFQAGSGATLDAVLGSLEAFKNFDVTSRLAELSMPVMVISGDCDRSYAVDGLVALANNIKNADLCLLPGGAHCVHLEQTDVFNSILMKFLTKARQ